MHTQPWLLNRPGTSAHEESSVDIHTEEAYDFPFSLIVWNDEVNTFEWVIETLMEVCGHSQEQAEQCAMLIHTKGKYAVKHGSYDDLKPQCDAITDRGIGATIEIAAGS
jgi:ATP-dependent Clp protease adaptor protein ClpS